jgi:hypothetical protein
VKQKGKSLQKQPNECSKKHFIIVPRQIHFLRFILEAYEGIGMVTTLDANLGLIEVSVAPGCEEEVAQVLRTEAENLQLRPVSMEHGAVRDASLAQGEKCFTCLGNKSTMGSRNANGYST